LHRRAESTYNKKRYHYHYGLNMDAALRTWLLGFSILMALLAVGRSAAAGGDDARTVLHMLEYVGADYHNAVSGGRVKSQTEYQEQQEFSASVLAGVRGLPERPQKAALVKDAQRLVEGIQGRAPADRIAGLSSRIAAALIAAYGIPIAPRQAPDVPGAASLFDSHCSACHGATGEGNGPAAAQLSPRPTNFRDAAWQANRTVYGLYNSITLGVDGTAMRAFDGLSDAQRWALAFYVSSLADNAALRRQGEEALSRGGQASFSDLASLTAPTPAQVRAHHGAEAAAVFAYLRSRPDRVEQQSEPPLGFSARILGDSARAYAAGDRHNAEQLAVKAYLEGFELVESGLRAVDPELAQRIEGDMALYRGMIHQGRDVATVTAQARSLEEALQQAAEKMGMSSLSPAMSFFSSLIILLREGLEAILVLAAIAAFLVKAERRDALRYVHYGWVGALLLGGLTWFLASRMVTVSGASRELTEGVSALVASGMLVYVGYWLHTRSHARQWQAFIHGRVAGALGQGTLWGLAAIAFLAVYREVFETVLFYQSLWLQTDVAGQGALLAGLGVAAVFLVALAWLILKFSVRLPLRLFFTANAILLFVLAVVLAGKGVAALQEAGKLPIDPVHFPSIDFLGVYPNLQSLLAQFALLALALTWLGYRYLSARE
jgi:high-affinity iron transporter